MLMLALAVLATVALVAPTAYASPSAVIRDCAEDGDLDRNYSNDDLRGTQGKLPADLDEYSDCREVIAGAITGGSNKGKGQRKRPAAASVADEERAALAEDREALEGATRPPGGRPKVKIGDQTIQPGKNGLFDLASAVHDMPAPLLLSLISLGLLALGTGGWALRRRIPALANLTLPNVPFLRR